MHEIGMDNFVNSTLKPRIILVNFIGLMTDKSMEIEYKQKWRMDKYA